MGLLASCSSGAQQLTGHVYLSMAITENGAARPLVDGTRVRISIGEAEGGNRDVGALVASAGCNSISGTYRIDGGRLAFDSAGMTEIGCDPQRHAQDDWLATFLASKPTVVVQGNGLTLDSGSIAMRLLDREIAEPDLNLVGPTWTVESILQGDAAMSVPHGATATLVFKADGTVDVDAGCNRGGGTWKLEGAGLAISSLAMTKMACAGPGAQLESSVLQVLGAGTLNAQIDASLLTITGGGAGLQLRGG